MLWGFILRLQNTFETKRKKRKRKKRRSIWHFYITAQTYHILPSTQIWMTLFTNTLTILLLLPCALADTFFPSIQQLQMLRSPTVVSTGRFEQKHYVTLQPLPFFLPSGYRQREWPNHIPHCERGSPADLQPHSKVSPARFQTQMTPKNKPPIPTINGKGKMDKGTW